MKRGIAVTAAGVAFSIASAARADLGSPAGALTVDEGLCFDRETLAARIAHWATSPLDPSLHVHVTREGRRVAFALRRENAVVGERALDLPTSTCAGETEAVALAIAVALDANQVEPPPPREPAEPPAPSEGEAGPDAPAMRLSSHAARAERALSRSRAAPSSASLSVAPAAAVGVLPQAAPGLAMGLEQQWTRHLETHLALLTATEESAPSSFDVPSVHSVRSTLLTTVLDGCLGGSVVGARLRACAGGAFGVVASGTGSAGIQVPPVAWGGPTLRLDAGFHLNGSLAFLASVDGFAPLLHPARQVESGGGFFPSMPPLPAYGMAAGLGLIVDL